MRNLLTVLLLLPILGVGQKPVRQYSLDANYYYGSILPHSKKIQHLITDHPEGVLVSFNRKTFGSKEWESRFNYPDYGLVFHFQNNKSEMLGDLYGVFGQLTFYFLKRNLALRVGQGIAYNTNPYDKEENYRNLAFGTHFMPTSLFMLNYQKENIWEGLGVKGGLLLIHHSNGTIKTPNTSANTVGANIGIHYTFDHKNVRDYLPRVNKDSVYTEPVKYTLAYRSGVHESHIIGSGQYPFYTFSFYADKRISRSSAFQAGIDFFLSMMYKHEIEMMAVSFPEMEVESGTDYKRAGAFLGYELFLDKLSFEGQLGAYFYDPYGANTFLYQHLAIKYYFYKNVFLGAGLKTHFSNAEAIEFSLGIRL